MRRLTRRHSTSGTGRQELNAGRFDAAEQEFRAALTLDPQNASAHRELAEIDRRRGKLDDAVQELKLSLAARDSAAVRIVLARIYLEQKKTDLARAEVEKAVKLAPNYPEAKELLEHLDRKQVHGRCAVIARGWNQRPYSLFVCAFIVALFVPLLACPVFRCQLRPWRMNTTRP